MKDIVFEQDEIRTLEDEARRRMHLDATFKYRVDLVTNIAVVAGTRGISRHQVAVVLHISDMAMRKELELNPPVETVAFSEEHRRLQAVAHEQGIHALLPSRSCARCLEALAREHQVHPQKDEST